MEKKILKTSSKPKICLIKKYQNKNLYFGRIGRISYDSTQSCVLIKQIKSLEEGWPLGLYIIPSLLPYIYFFSVAY